MTTTTRPILSWTGKINNQLASKSNTNLLSVALALRDELAHDAPRAEGPHVRRAALPQHLERHRHAALQRALVHLRHRRLEVVELGTAATVRGRGGRVRRRRARLVVGGGGRRGRGRGHRVTGDEGQRGGVQTLGRLRRLRGGDPREPLEDVERLGGGVVLRGLRGGPLPVKLPRAHLEADAECRWAASARGDGKKPRLLLFVRKSEKGTFVRLYGLFIKYVVPLVMLHKWVGYHVGLMLSSHRGRGRINRRRRLQKSVGGGLRHLHRKGVELDGRRHIGW